MSDRVTPPRKTLADLIKESAAVSSDKRTNALLGRGFAVQKVPEPKA